MRTYRIIAITSFLLAMIIIAMSYRHCIRRNKHINYDEIFGGNYE